MDWKWIVFVTHPLIKVLRLFLHCIQKMGRKMSMHLITMCFFCALPVLVLYFVQIERVKMASLSLYLSFQGPLIITNTVYICTPSSAAL